MGAALLGLVVMALILGVWLIWWLDEREKFRAVQGKSWMEPSGTAPHAFTRSDEVHQQPVLLDDEYYSYPRLPEDWREWSK